MLSYGEARTAVTHPHLEKNPESALPAMKAVGLTGHEIGEGFGGSMLFSDPPDHTRLRRLVAPAFSARRTALLARRVQEIAAELLDAMAAQGDGEDGRLSPVEVIAMAVPLGWPVTTPPSTCSATPWWPCSATSRS